jgi:hypothetical protein
VISLAVDGSPAGCRQAALDLLALRTRLTTLADEAALVRAGSSGAWTGLAGDRFRARAGAVVTAADEQAEVVSTVATALDTLADRIEGVRQAMAAARAVAVGAGIPISGDALPPALGLPPAQLDAHARALTAVGHAREREAEAQQAWASVLARLPGAWEPARDPRLREGSRQIQDLGPFERVRPLVGRVEVLLRDWFDESSGPPSLPPVPPLPPLVPLPGPGVLGPGLLLDQARRVQEEVWEQMDRDTDLKGLTLTERLARGVLMGTTTGVGAFGGIALCMRFSLTRNAVPVCGEIGSRVGEEAGHQILRAVDER